ncbi:MAG: SGNH/GDSL hydrolase family protein [Ruminiclostridium sp.]|nr:SGNH/GDSL hydrolase family protein [Ruminiclostridium sp.]
MKRKPAYKAFVMLLSAVMALGSCSQDISGSIPAAATVNIPEEVTSSTAAATEAVTEKTTTTTEKTTVVTTTSETTTTEAETTAESATEPPETVQTQVSEELVETYKTYVMSDAYNDFISKCVFVGDSICSGFKAYGILPPKNVLAQGNVAARSIYDYTFKVNGDEMSILAALLELKPEYVVFSMGMNDVNMTSEQTFCENYGELLSQVESFLPDATLIVCSITPITYGESGKLFTYPSNIDSFNAALKEYLDASEKWIYCDITHDMKNSLNLLKSAYLGSPDGVHLAPDAYYAIMYQICERMVDGRIYNADGTLAETEPAETTTAPTETKPETTKKTSEKTDKTPESDTDDSLSGTIIISDED